MARTINGASGGLKYAGSTIPAAWTVAAWIRPRTNGAHATYGGRIFSVQQTTSTWPETIIFTLRNSGGTGTVSSLALAHNLSGVDAEAISTAGTLSRDVWQFVAGVHYAIGTKPVLYVGDVGSPIGEPGYSGQTGGSGASVGSGGATAIGSAGNQTAYWFDGDLAHVTFWSRALTRAELEWWRAVTVRAAGTVASAGPLSSGLAGYWPLSEPGNMTARDWTGNRPMTATSTRAALSPRLTPIVLRRPLAVPPSGSSATATPSTVTSAGTVYTPGLAASATVAAATVTSTGTVHAPTVLVGTTVPAPAVTGTGAVGGPAVTASATVAAPAATGTVTVHGGTPSTDSARTLDGTNDGFSNTAATAITTAAWSWCGHVKLDSVTATHYLWRTETSSATRVSSVSVELSSGRYRLRAYQLLANFTYHQATWELPLPLGTEVTIGVTFDNTNRVFHAYAGTATIPMVELQWRSEMAQGTSGQPPYSAVANDRWHISPSTGRVDGAVSQVCVTNDTLTVAEMDQIRRYGDPPAGGNLLGWWTFAESSGNAADSSGNSRTMTASGSPGTAGRDSVQPAESSNSLTLASVTDWQTFQRDGSDEADIPIEGTYAASPSTIEARFVELGSSPGSWTTIDPAPSGGTYTGSLTVAAGQGTLEVRANHAGTYSVVRRGYVAVGDIYWTVGTSNCTGYATNLQSVGTTQTTWQFGSMLPSQLSNWDVAGVHQWITLGDPTDARQGSIYFAPSTSWVQAADATRETVQPSGSWLPLLAGRLTAAHGVPVAFCQLGHIGSTLAQWRKSAATMWAELEARCEQVAGAATPLTAGAAGKAVLAVQGENDYGSTTSTTFATDVAAWADEIAADLAMPTVLMNVGDWPGTSGYNYTSHPNDGITLVRDGIMDAVASSANAELGPTMYDVDLADGGGDGQHYKTDTEMSTVADRWFAALTELYYGGASGVGHGPRVTSAVLAGTTVTVTFDTALDAATTYPGVSVYHGASNTSATRLTWVASAPAAGQYTCERAGSTTMTVGLGFTPTSPIWIGIGEWDLSAGLAVPAATKSPGGVAVTLPAEMVTDLTAMPAPTTVTSTGTVHAPTVTASATAAPARITTSGTVHAPDVSGGTGLTITPGLVTGSGAVGAPTVTVSATVAAAAVTGTGTVHAPAVVGGADTTVIAAVVSASGAVPVPAVASSATVAAATVTGTSTVHGGIPQTSSATTVLPATVESSGVVPAPAVAASATVACGGVAGAGTVHAPQVASGQRNLTIRVTRRRGRRWKNRP